jgi:hypothetical protein
MWEVASFAEKPVLPRSLVGARQVSVGFSGKNISGGNGASVSIVLLVPAAQDMSMHELKVAGIAGAIAALKTLANQPPQV